MELPSVDLKITNPRLKDLGALPRRATDGSAGYDIAACIDSKVVLFPGQTFDFDLGFAIAIPDPRWALFFIPRSGLGVKSGIILANGVGLIDSDYRGTCKLSIWNPHPNAQRTQHCVLSAG
ncbi:deoxyuridine 5'-triphosphate nucleotidohydrolase [Salipiger mucosus]|uniref:dUTP diphosphatase n=1 Tax=Salipiger mucosus DSM 16094 TaxID=1123237 RepID=S9SBW2_9RHOB|nr:deoxyuridine 5'-triphosphate nucleotidohydrolase [Salipiger mucosus]EPX83724.1 Deoxyuridine 5'-triphosphate nucleotidohydrolase [Salipiger mucosus DSM 16094]